MDKLRDFNLLFSVDKSPVYHGEELNYVDIKTLTESQRKKVRVSALSMYGDSEWNMTTEMPESRPREVTLRFDRIKFSDGTTLADKENKIYLNQVKEYHYTLYTYPTPRQCKWSTYIDVVNAGIQYLCSFMKENSISYFSDVNEHDLDDLLVEISTMPHSSGRPLTNRTLHSRVRGLAWLYQQSAKMKHGLKADPFRDFDGSEVTWANRSAKILIPRVGATKAIPDDFLRKLLSAAINEIADLKKIERLGQYFCDWESARMYSQAKRERLVKAKDYSEGCASHKDISYQAQLVESACYILVAFLTGMRVHEVTAIRPGLEESWKEMLIELDGSYKKVHFVLTHTKKLEAEPRSDQWQTVPIVKRALIAMNQLNKLWIEKGCKHLFTQKISGGGGVFAVNASDINLRLKRFCLSHQIQASDEVAGEWNLTSHQFRKTHARIMIRQGLGLKALQDQLKHYDIEMTKVYGEIGLYAELQQEKFNLSTELYEEFIGSQVPIIGGGAEKVAEYRKIFMGLAKEDREEFLQSLPKSALIEQTDDGLCMYRPKKALCGGNKNNCVPSLCENSVINANENRRAIEFKLGENERLITFFGKDSFKVAHLQRRNAELFNLAKQLEEVGE